MAVVQVTNVLYNQPHTKPDGSVTQKHVLQYVNLRDGKPGSKSFFLGSKFFGKLQEMNLQSGSTITIKNQQQGVQPNGAPNWNVVDIIFGKSAGGAPTPPPSPLIFSPINRGSYQQKSISQAGPTAKDISMEVSGILQAVVSSGKHIGSEETELRRLLSIKRKVAVELESGAFTALTEDDLRLSNQTQDDPYTTTMEVEDPF